VYSSVGLVFDGGSSFTLPRLVGLAKSLELAMLDEPMKAEECLRLGLASRVVPDAELLGAAAALAAKAAGRAVGAFGRAKKLLNSSFERSLDAQLEVERLAITSAAESPEGREGITAFLEKRPPKFPPLF
jgi:2-(1,2-epoxy-1,2-dihydrophenyl)acetyl-CoA isomerase